MKKFVFAVVATLLIPTLSFAAPSTLVLANYSSATGANNVAKTCAVLKGSANVDGTFRPDSMTSYALTAKTGTGSITLTSNADYKITCFQTTIPETAAVVKMYFGTASTVVFPLSTFLFRQGL